MPETRYPAAGGKDEKVVTLGTTRAGRRLKVVTLQAEPDYIVAVADRDVDK